LGPRGKDQVSVGEVSLKGKLKNEVGHNGHFILILSNDHSTLRCWP